LACAERAHFEKNFELSTLLHAKESLNVSLNVCLEIAVKKKRPMINMAYLEEAGKGAFKDVLKVSVYVAWGNLFLFIA
jgi:hypothetical protein